MGNIFVKKKNLDKDSQDCLRNQLANIKKIEQDKKLNKQHKLRDIDRIERIMVLYGKKYDISSFLNEVKKIKQKIKKEL